MSSRASRTERSQVANLNDVEKYLAQIRNTIRQYERLVDRLSSLKKNKKNAVEIMDLCSERTRIKEAFISRKQAARSNIKLLKDGMDIMKERELASLQAEFRQIDSDFKALGIMADRDALFDGVNRRGKEKEDPSRMTNDELLNRAKGLEKDNLEKLKGGLLTIESAKEQAKHTAVVLEQDREKMARIREGLDEVESELDLSRLLITRFVKRMATDKIIIAFATLIVLGIVGIIIYATLNPDQKLFNVPDAVKPTEILPPTPSPAPTDPATRRMLRTMYE